MKSTVKLIHGHSLKVLRKAKSNSVDTIITDPPYGISFMGKKWDYDVPSVELWAECLRVLKPGGTALIFAGSRTQHRMAVNVEDAGFDIKDTIMWIYGSGFPKATDVSKQLDKLNGREPKQYEELGKYLKEKRGERPQKEISKLFLSKTGRITGCLSKWEHGVNVPTQAQWIVLQQELKLDNRFDDLIERVGAEREVIGKQKLPNRHSFAGERYTENNGSTEKNITISKTPEAKEWNGWKSHGLKPAYEPIIVAVKPNEGTYAENALKWGVSGLNIEGGRVESKPRKTGSKPISDEKTGSGITFAGSSKNRQAEYDNQNHDRFPSNIILDEDDVEGEEWRRYFYCAKASKSERNAGCEGLEEITDSEMTSRKEGSSGLDWNDGKGGNAFAGASSSRGTNRKNNHPTVKPLKLIEYLCILTKTPTGGRVLDPFMGSGTTGVACVNTGRRFIGIDKELESVVIAKHRTQHAINKVEKHKKLTDSYLI